MQQNWITILERGDLTALSFGPETFQRAHIRACNLALLHHCKFTQDDEACKFVVHAEKWYSNAR